MKVLIAPDKFKGTLDAFAAARAIARGWQRARPTDHIVQLPLSDGGDGFGDVLSRPLHARVQWTKSVDAAGRPTRVAWWWEPRSKTALVESAKSVGLAMLPSGKFHPFQLDTSGLGPVLEAVSKKKPSRCIIGIGGSATNDGGFGMALALGWRFLNHSGKPITSWTGLPDCERIEPPQRAWKIETIVAIDVTNPLLGAQGCSRIFGPQKGLRPADFPLAERSLKVLGQRVREMKGLDLSIKPGAGAAGGLGFGLMAFLDAQPESGFELFRRHARLDRLLQKMDLVITGEGAIDAQTLMGKGVGQLATVCRAARVPCIGLSGVNRAPRSRGKLFSALFGLTEYVTIEQAMQQTARHLSDLARRAATEWKG